MLYKYLHREHAQLLMEKGTLRIGTLYEYRDTEKHGNVVGDADEGQKSLYMDVNDEKWTCDNQRSFGKKFIKVSPGASVHLENVAFEEKQNSPNCYIYSAAQEFDEKALRNFGYDACIVIENPAKFFYAITRALRDKAVFEGFFPCQYVSRRVAHDQDHGIHPALIKDPSYKEQKEVRAVWKPFHEVIGPLIIDCPYVIKHCYWCDRM